MFKNFIASLVAGLIASSACAQTPVREVAGISEYRLDNGLQVLFMPVAGAGRTYLTVTYKVGSRMEGPQEAGMAHLLEHVTFRGVRGEDGQALDLGAEIKKLPLAGSNGTTTEDRTNYFENFGADEAVLARLLELESLRMHAARLADADFAKEKPIVLNEMGMRGEGIARQMFQGLMGGVFRSHPYGRPVIGYPKDIEQLSLPTLRRFYETWYRPDNAVLMIAGEFDPAAALALVQRSFGKLAKPATPVPELALTEPPQNGPRLVTLRTGQSAVGVAYRVPGMAHPQAAAVMVMLAMLPNIRSDLKPNVGDVGAPIVSPIRGHDPTLAALILPMPQAASRDAAARTALAARAESWAEALERATLRSGSSDEQVVQLRIEAVRNQLRQALRNPGAASALISDAVGAGDWRLSLRLLDDLNQLKASQVIRAYDAYVRPENRTLAVGVTDAALAAPEFSERPVGGLRGLFSKPVQVEDVKDAGATVGTLDKAGAEVGSTGGAAFQLDPAQLDRDVKRQRLPSGLLLALLDRKTADDRVRLQLRLRWGDAPSMAAEQGWRALVDKLLESGIDGQRRFTAEQVQVIKTRTQVDYAFSSGPQGLTVLMSMPRETLPAGIALLRGLLREPVLDEAAFERVKAQALSQLAANPRGASWAPELARQHHMLALGLGPNRAGYEPGARELAEIWRKLDVKTARSYWERFWSANDARLSLVGPLPENVSALIEAQFGDWKKPAAPPFERYVPSHVPEAGARFVSHAAVGRDDGGQATARVSWQQDVPLNERDAEAMPLALGLRILAAAGTSGSRLSDRLRGQDAMSYGVDYQLRLPQHGNAAGLRINAIAAPAQALRAEAAIREEIARLLEQGITAAELDTVKRQYRTARADALRNDANLGGLLINQFDRNEGFAATFTRDEAALDAATVESVNAALRKLLLPDHWVVVITGAASEKVEKAEKTEAKE